jgi:hypothetical protein
MVVILVIKVGEPLMRCRWLWCRPTETWPSTADRGSGSELDRHVQRRSEGNSRPRTSDAVDEVSKQFCV